MNYAAQKAALTRAVRSGDVEKVKAACRAAVIEWDQHYWPDDWARWQRALDDMLPWHSSIRIEDLR